MTEREALQQSLTAAKWWLDHYRDTEKEIQADLVEADINRMLERLTELPPTEPTETTE